MPRTPRCCTRLQHPPPSVAPPDVPAARRVRRAAALGCSAGRHQRLQVTCWPHAAHAALLHAAAAPPPPAAPSDVPATHLPGRAAASAAAPAAVSGAIRRASSSLRTPRCLAKPRVHWPMCPCLSCCCTQWVCAACRRVAAAAAAPSDGRPAACHVCAGARASCLVITHSLVASSVPVCL